MGGAILGAWATWRREAEMHRPHCSLPCLPCNACRANQRTFSARSQSHLLGPGWAGHTE